MDDSTTTYWLGAAADLQAASTQRTYTGFEGSTSAGSNGNTEHLPWAAPAMVLYPGHRLRSSCLNLDPGDQYDQIGLLVEELPSGRYFDVQAAGPLTAEPWIPATEVFPT